MKKKSALLGIYLPIYLLLLLSSVILRTVALFYHLDRYGYFTNDTLINISNYSLIFGSLFFLTYIFFSRKEIKLIPSFLSPMNYIPSALMTVALCFMAFNLFVIYRNTTKDFIKYSALIAAILAVLSIIYFILNIIFIRTVSARRAALGICAVAFLIAYTIYVYTDPTLPINSHSKIVDELAYLFSAVFFLYEVRLSLGREKWKLYISFGFIASLLTAYSAIPTLIYYFAEGRMISDSIYETALTLTIFIFITAKLFLTTDLLVDENSPIVERICAASAARTEIVNPAPTEETEEIEAENEAETDAEDENQLTISDITPEEDEVQSEEQLEGSDTEEASQ